MNGYAIYFEADGVVHRLPVNPEQVTRNSKMDVEQYRILSGGQIAIPSGKCLDEYSFEAEFPFQECHYSNQGFENADIWERNLRSWQEKKTVLRLIISNNISDENSLQAVVTQVQAVEKAGEEGDKYLAIKILEYAAPEKRYAAAASVKRSSTEVQNPAVASGNKTHTVVKGDTLWDLAKKYYGSGNKYTIIYNANLDKIKKPNLIYPGQILTIPA